MWGEWGVWAIEMSQTNRLNKYLPNKHPQKTTDTAQANQSCERKPRMASNNNRKVSKGDQACHSDPEAENPKTQQPFGKFGGNVDFPFPWASD